MKNAQNIENAIKPEQTRLPEAVFDDMCKYLQDSDDFLSNLTIIENKVIKKGEKVEKDFETIDQYLENRFQLDNKRQEYTEVKKMFYQEIGEELPSTSETDKWRFNNETIPIIDDWSDIDKEEEEEVEEEE